MEIIVLKTICIIRSNPVDPDSRVEKEARSLINMGYGVQILAWDRNSTHKDERSNIAVFGSEIPIIRIGEKAGFGEGIKSLKSFLKFQFRMILWLLKNRDYYNAVHACDFDTAFFSYFIAKALRKKFVFDIFDFLASEPVNVFQKIIKKMEFFLINRADATIICTEDRKSQIEGSNPKYLAVIHNAPYLGLMNDNSELIKTVDKTKINVVYVGILQADRMLKQIGNYFCKHSEIVWHIAGFGYLDEHISKLAESHSNIEYHGKISYSDALALENACDIMLAIYDPKIENNRNCAPNKYYESLMLGKPLIMVKGTGMSSIISDNNFGVSIEYSEDGFREGVEELIKIKRKWKEISNEMKEYYHRNYDWNIMEDRLRKLYDYIFICDI